MSVNPPANPQPNTEPPPEGEPPPAPPPSGPPSPPGPERTFSQAEVNALIDARLRRERETAEARQRKAAEDAEQAKLKEQGEYKRAAETAEARLRALEAEIAARDLADLKRAVGRDKGIPENLALRLVGETREDLERDADVMAALLAPPAPPGTGPRMVPNAPPGNAPNPRPAAPGGERGAEQTRQEWEQFRPPVGRL